MPCFTYNTNKVQWSFFCMSLLAYIFFTNPQRLVSSFLGWNLKFCQLEVMLLLCKCLGARGTWILLQRSLAWIHFRLWVCLIRLGSHPERPAFQLSRRLCLAIEVCAPLGSSHRVWCQHVSQGSRETFSLSCDPVTWQGHSEVSWEKLIEGSSLTPLVVFSEGQSPGHSVGSWEKEWEKIRCCNLEEPGTD